MANQAGASLHAVAMRVTGLTATGSHAAQPVYVTDNLVKFDFNPDVETGPEVSERNAAGNVYVAFKIQDIIKRLTASLELVTNDPELEALLTGGTIYTSGGGTGSAAVQGYQYPALNNVSQANGVSVELWTHNIAGGVTGGGSVISSSQPYQRWVFPRLYLRKTNRTIDINRLASAFDGFAIENPNWGAGPAGDFPFDSSKVAQWCYATTLPTLGIGSTPAAQ